MTDPCPTCTGQTRETTGMVCQTCGTDYAPSPDRALDAQRAAENRLEGLLGPWEDEEEGEASAYSLAPFCGCVTCLVREALHAAWPHLRALALEDAATELERRMRTFPMEGRNTRAGWATAVLRDLAGEDRQ